MHRQFVLPIALHKAIGSRRFTEVVGAMARRASACCASFGSPVTLVRRTVRVLVTGATGFTGGHLAHFAGGAGPYACVRSCATGAARRTLEAPGSSSWRATCAIGRSLDRARRAASSVVYHIAAIYRQAGLPAEVYRAVNATRGSRP